MEFSCLDPKPKLMHINCAAILRQIKQRTEKYILATTVCNEKSSLQCEFCSLDPNPGGAKLTAEAT